MSQTNKYKPNSLNEGIQNFLSVTNYTELLSTFHVAAQINS
jgi:hypothetical protein